MKVGGPKGPPPKKTIDKSDRVGGEVGGADFRDALDETARSSSAEAASPPPDLIAEITGKIESGQLTPSEGVARVVDAIVTARGAGLPPERREQLRAALDQALAEDPMLAAQLDRLATR